MLRWMLVAAGAIGLLASCDEHPATQTVVFLHAEPTTAMGASQLRLTVSSNEAIVVGPRTDSVDRGGTLLATVPLVPRDDDPKRTFELLAELLVGDTVASTLRVGGGYVEDELREIHVWFDPACDGVADCGPGRTCSQGTCMAACYDGEPPSSERFVSRPRCGECARCNANRCEPLANGSPCGCAADTCDAGECVAARPISIVDLAYGHGCAASRGDLYCWGDRHADRVLVSSDTPVRVDDIGGVTDIGLGGASTCVTRVLSGPRDVRTCWGWNQEGRLAVGSTETTPPPTDAPDSDPAFAEVSGALNFHCGISRTEEIYCWGNNAGRPIGDPIIERCERTADEVITTWDVPMLVTSETGFRDLDAGWQAACAVHRDGRAFCWGFNCERQLGRTDADSASPACVQSPDGACLDGFTDAAVYNEHGCGVRHGELWCWGAPLDGGDNVDPHRIGALGDWEQVTIGSGHACALRDGGKLYCFGANDSGQLGVGDLQDRTEPTPVVLFAEQQWVALATTNATTCGIDGGGSLYCWGNDLGSVPGSMPAPGLLGLGPLPDDHERRPRRVCVP